jgi:hypothetical protein
MVKNGKKGQFWGIPAQSRKLSQNAEKNPKNGLFQEVLFHV